MGKLFAETGLSVVGWGSKMRRLAEEYDTNAPSPVL